MSDDLHIRVLGPLTLTRGGRELPGAIWRSRQERRLLGMLLAARGGRVPAERLIERLWPDAEPSAANTTLRSTVSALRHALEPARGARASSRYVLTRPGGYAWNSAGGAWVDLDEFLNLTDDLQSPSDQPPPALDEPREPRLERAIALYRGEFLADETDAAWADRLREMLRERFLHAVYDLAELRLSQGEYDHAIALARRGLDHDPLREPLYRTLMQAQAYAGDPAGALQSYERCRRALDDDLGAMPAPQTRALHAAILRGELAERAPVRQGDEGTRGQGDKGTRGQGDNETRGQAGRLVSPSLPVSQSPSLPVSRSPSPPALRSPFVGRAGELAALRGWIGGLAQARGGVVAVIGEAGIGKTRLVAEALREVREQVFAIVLRCAPLERGLPFASLSEALRPLVRAAPIELLRKLPPAALAQVADLLPVLRERLPELPALAALPPGEARNSLLDGLVDMALALAHERPLIAWCDDAQWADEATLAVLGRLARHAPRRPLLVVLTYRSEELVENAALHQLLRTLGRAMLLHPLVLGRISQAAVAELLAEQAQLPAAQVARLADRLGAASGGNPLVLAVAVQALIEAHAAPSLAALLPTLPDDAPLPDLASAPPLRDLVLARIERLPAPARELLDLLAVLGRPASLDLLEQLAGPPALAAAQVLIERQFLAEGADQRLSFGHDLVRSIVLAELSLPQYRLLHRRAAEAIALLHGAKPARAAELAYHFERAGRGAEPELLRFALAAGDHARRAFGYRAALVHYDTALGTAERLGTHAPNETVRRAFVGRLLTAEALLDWDLVLATVQRHASWATHSGDAPLVAPQRLAVLRALMGDLAGAAELIGSQMHRQAEASAIISDLQQRTALLLDPDAASIGPANYADQLMLQFQPATPPPGEPAAELPELLGAEPAALLLFQVGWATLMQGLLATAAPCLQRAHDLAGATGQAAVAVVSALQLSHLHALRGDRAAAASWLEASLDTAQRAPEAAWASIWPQIHQAFVLLLDDQAATARARFGQLAAQLRDRPAFQSHRASVEVGLGLLDIQAGDPAQASQRLQAALATPQLLYGFTYSAAQHGLARLAAQQGELVQARARLAQALAYSTRRQLLPEYVRSAIEAARIERDFGAPAQALPLLRAAASLAAQFGLGALAHAAAALLQRLEQR